MLLKDGDLTMNEVFQRFFLSQSPKCVMDRYGRIVVLAGVRKGVFHYFCDLLISTGLKKSSSQ